MSRSRIIIPRKLLLVEIERRCAISDCNAKRRLGLTKDEARAYSGFECERCRKWNIDVLSERDVPEWWCELAVTDMYAIRDTKMESPAEIGDVITRMSENYRETRDGE